MALRPTWSVQRLSSTVPQARTQSRSSTLGPIALGRKQTGAPSAGNPHAGCDEAGTGNRLTDRLVRHSQRKRRETDRSVLRGTTPVLDPTRGICGRGIELRNLRIREQTVSSKPESNNVVCDNASASRPCGVEDPTHA